MQIDVLEPGPIADLLGRQPLAGDRPGDLAVPRREPDALAEQHLRGDAADRRHREQAGVVDVRDREPDLVDVTDEREGRRIAPTRRRDARETRAERVGRNRREATGGLAPEPRGRFLVTRRAVGFEQGGE